MFKIVILALTMSGCATTKFKVGECFEHITGADSHYTTRVVVDTYKAPNDELQYVIYNKLYFEMFGSKNYGLAPVDYIDGFDQRCGNLNEEAAKECQADKYKRGIAQRIDCSGETTPI